MTFVQAVQACRQRWWIPALLVLISVVAVYALDPASSNQKPQYVASTIQLVNPAGNGSSPVNLSEAQLEVKVGPVPVAAAKILKYHGDPVQLASLPQVTTDPSVGTLTISVTGPDGAYDAKVANAFANALNLHVTNTAITAYQNQLNTIQNQLNSLQNQINQNETKTDPVSQAKVGGLEDQYRVSFDQFQQLAAQGQPAQSFSFLQRATPVRAGGGGLPKSRLAQALIAGAVALLIGLAIAILLDLLRPRIRDRVDAKREFGCAVLAEVPRLSRRQRRRYAEVGADDNFHLGAYQESYRMLRTAILLEGGGDPYRSNDQHAVDGQQVVTGPQLLLVASAGSGEGKSTTVANLAVAMAETGREVLVVDTDFRAPTVHLAFGLKPGPGLTDLITDPNLSGDLVDLVHPTSVPGVSLVHGGSSVENAAELVATKGAHLLAQARSLADVVIMDTAPLLVVSDGAELLQDVDAVMLVARVHKTTRDSARRTFELLDRANVPVLGVVLIGTEGPAMSFYGRHYGYGPTNAKDKWRHRFFRSRRDDVVRVDARTRRFSGATTSVGAGHRLPGPDDPDPEYLRAIDALDGDLGPVEEEADHAPPDAAQAVGTTDGGAGRPRHSREQPGTS
jgi:capsular exopolysaccharide synthesis family protein